jgi:hypothetical protein
MDEVRRSNELRDWLPESEAHSDGCVSSSQTIFIHSSAQQAALRVLLEVPQLGGRTSPRRGSACKCRM